MLCIAYGCTEPARGTIAVSADASVGVCGVHLVKWIADENDIRGEPPSALKILKINLRLHWLTSDAYRADPSESAWKRILEAKLDEMTDISSVDLTSAFLRNRQSNQRADE